MTKKKNTTKLVYKLLSYSIILVIFYFLGRNLVDGWEKIENYQFSFNYFYLILSYVFLVLGVMMQSFIWNSILRVLDKNKKISHSRAFYIFVYSWFGRYVPGKAWMYVGRIYFGAKEGISKKALTLSAIYEIVLTITSGFFLSIFLVSIIFGHQFMDTIGTSSFYLFFPILIMIFSLIFIHPCIFYFFINKIFRKILKRFRDIEIDKKDFLNYNVILKMFFYYCIGYLFFGAGFFFLVKSMVYISFSNILGIIGIFELASILGVLAVFAPSGLGVRDGILVLLLQIYFPLSMAVLISLIARIWATLGEIGILGSIWIWSKLKYGNTKKIQFK